MDDRTFTCYPKLPDEIKLHIWREAAKHTPPCVFELHDLVEDDGEGYIKISNINLLKKSMPVHRPILEVDKLSRKECLKHFQRVNFHDTAIYNYMNENLLGLFSDGDRALDPFFKTVQHYAFGTDAFLGYLETEPEEENDDEDEDEDAQDHLNPTNWGLKEMQRLSSARSITVVLDGVRWDEDQENIPEGSITFCDAGDCLPGGCLEKFERRHFGWISYLSHEWLLVAERHPEWNVPKLSVKSICRGNGVEVPNFNKWPANLLPRFVINDQRRRYMMVDEEDSDDGDSGWRL